MCSVHLGPFLGSEACCGCFLVVLGGASLSSSEGQIVFCQVCSYILTLGILSRLARPELVVQGRPSDRTGHLHGLSSPKGSLQSFYTAICNCGGQRK